MGSAAAQERLVYMSLLTELGVFFVIISIKISLLRSKVGTDVIGER